VSRRRARLPLTLALLGLVVGAPSPAGNGPPVWRVLTVDRPAVVWLVAVAPGRLASLDADGRLEVLAVNARALTSVASHARVGARDAPPVALELGRGRHGVAFVTPDGGLALWNETGVRVAELGARLSALTRPTVVPGEPGALLALARDGALLRIDRLGADARVAARLSINALPDARIALSPSGEVVVPSDATERYAHGVLGDAVEAGALAAAALTGPRLVALEPLTLPPTEVFEDLRALLADVDGDGQPEALITRSSLGQGGAVLALGRRAGRWETLAAARPLGRPQRWVHVVGAADLDGDGAVEVVWLRTPHLGGVLEAARVRGGALEPVAAHAGLSSHALGSRNLEQAALADLAGEGRPEVVVPVQRRDTLLGLALGPAGFAERWRYRLRDEITSNLVVADLDGDGALDLAVADRTAVHVLLNRRESTR